MFRDREKFIIGFTILIIVLSFTVPRLHYEMGNPHEVTGNVTDVTESCDARFLSGCETIWYITIDNESYTVDNGKIASRLKTAHSQNETVTVSIHWNYIVEVLS